MNSEQINLVQSSFKDVRPIAALTADIFYTRLFVLDPSLRTMFKGDLVDQGRMLMSMLSTAVNGLTNLDATVPVVRQLGMRHAKYGVQDEHFDTVGSALLWTLEQGLGEKFTADVREAWTAAYALLASVMQLGLIEARSQQAAAA
ncbi:globin family protein [Polaromonas sp. A23]|uniref:globin family protein n=1 Tax=Polaromonas sp. A23 TaxID=1944133 RepID=UPI000985D00A|nr:globin family protein [Polaromonas sp. A23]OOG47612.1 hemin receptor [Polaromonas sp. A23]